MILDAHAGGVSIVDLHQFVITRVQAEIGRMWQIGDLGVAEEHLGSRIIEEVLMVLRRRMPHKPANGRTVIVASSPGNGCAPISWRWIDRSSQVTGNRKQPCRTSSSITRACSH